MRVCQAPEWRGPRPEGTNYPSAATAWPELGSGAQHPGPQRAPATREEAGATVQEKIAETITRFTGSMLFVYIHLVIFGFWIIANLGWIPGVPLGRVVRRARHVGLG